MQKPPQRPNSTHSACGPTKSSLISLLISIRLDHTLHHWLKQVLPNHIKDSLALVEEPATFNEWKHLVQNIDQWYWERQAEICWDARLNSSTNTIHATPAPNAHNTLVGAPSTSATSTACDTLSSPLVAHHLTAQGALTQTEWDRQIMQGLCLYCGGQGHKVSECSKAWKARETMGRAAQLTPSESVPVGPSTMPSESKFTIISKNQLTIPLFVHYIIQTTQSYILQHSPPS